MEPVVSLIREMTISEKLFFAGAFLLVVYALGRQALRLGRLLKRSKSTESVDQHLIRSSPNVSSVSASPFLADRILTAFGLAGAALAVVAAVMFALSAIRS